MPYDTNSIEGNREMIRCNIIQEHLEAVGAKTQLIMFMTGAGGSGKSNVKSAFFERRELIHTYVYIKVVN
jgi:adenylylsulfate kinase-like enzyme